ncbi:hypothetical protein BC830DRAFT_1061750 [Chytriomyces sp. MP71]|nr:hypothetical protein BC830DRAFT_1061750 [Chytriomyces sp. MP71]
MWNDLTGPLLCARCRLSRCTLPRARALTDSTNHRTAFERTAEAVHESVFGGYKKHLNRPAIVDAVTGASFTYTEVVKQIDLLMGALYGELQFCKWDVVGVFSPNHLQFPVVIHAVIKAGGTVSPANPTYNANELAYQLKDSGAKYLFVHPALLDTALPAAAKVGIPDARIILLNEGPVNKSGGRFKTVKQVSEANFVPAPTVKFTADEIQNRTAYLCYSSGTTGLSKGVETTQRNVIANILQFDKFQEKAQDLGAREVWTGVLPFFHMYGLTISLHICFQRGYTLVVFPKFELPLFLTSLGKYHVTTAHIVPPIALALAKSPIVDHFKFPKLKTLMSGAAPLAPELVAEIWRRLHIKTVQGYGLTETSPVSHIMPLSYALEFPKSMGHLFPGMEARIVNPDSGKDCGLKEEGEIWMRGPNVMKGYHNNKTATANSIDKDGFFHTGDIGFVDENGLWYIVDRLKELIKYKGFQVPPAELEAYLLEHPAVADCAVIGRPDEAAGEVPRAYVVLKPKSNISASDIVGFIDKKVAPHKRLRGGVIFIDEIPKAASGKILRRVLREQDKATSKSSKL